MKITRLAPVLIAIVSTLDLSACSPYQVLQQPSLAVCDRLLDMAEGQRCRRANSSSQERYEAERQKFINKNREAARPNEAVGRHVAK